MTAWRFDLELQDILLLHRNVGIPHSRWICLAEGREEEEGQNEIERE